MSRTLQTAMPAIFKTLSRPNLSGSCRAPRALMLLPSFGKAQSKARVASAGRTKHNIRTTSVPYTSMVNGE